MADKFKFDGMFPQITHKLKLPQNLLKSKLIWTVLFTLRYRCEGTQKLTSWQVDRALQNVIAPQNVRQKGGNARRNGTIATV